MRPFGRAVLTHSSEFDAHKCLLTELNFVLFTHQKY